MKKNIPTRDKTPATTQIYVIADCLFSSKKRGLIVFNGCPAALETSSHLACAVHPVYLPPS